MRLPYKILVLDDDENALAGVAELLAGAEYDVTPAPTYDQASRLLARNAYDLLMTEVRLRGFNGLNLVKKCRAEHPEMAIVIVSVYDEALMQLEASRYHAVFVRKPVRPAMLLQAVADALAKVRRERRWPRKQVRGGFRVTAAGRPAAVVDVCYGGLRLEVPGSSQLPPSFAVEVSGIDLRLQVEPVWSCPADNRNAILCGAALASEGTTEASTWRAIVDRLSA